MPGGRPGAQPPAGRRPGQPGQARGRRTPAPAAAQRLPSPPAAVSVPGSDGLRRRKGSRTGLVIAVVAVLAVLGLSYANALRTYLSQQRDIAVLEAETSAKAASIAELEDEIARWDDPDYVRAQARARLGWVLPGETGYQVIGADGQLVASPAEQTAAAETSQEPWYERVWASLKAADVADLAVEDGPALAPGAAETPR